MMIKLLERLLVGRWKGTRYKVSKSIIIFNLWDWMLKFKSRASPADSFTILGLQNPSHNVLKLHKILVNRWSLKLENRQKNGQEISSET